MGAFGGVCRISNWNQRQGEHQEGQIKPKGALLHMFHISEQEERPDPMAPNKVKTFPGLHPHPTLGLIG